MKNISDIKTLLEQLNANPKKSLGQNFLVSEHVIKKIIQTVKSFEPDQLVEVGPGLGALTDDLLKFEKPITLIEMDKAFAQHWRGCDQVDSFGSKLNVIEGDALQVPWNFISERVILVSNLPYQISSSIVIERSVKNDVYGMVLMFQKEVAQRIMAKPKTEEYGMLSVIAQTYWQIENLLEAGPRDFYPPPKIASRVLVFRKTQFVMAVETRVKFLQFVKRAFSQRRKLLSKNIGIDSGRLVDLGFNEKARAEELSIQQFIDLFNKLNYVGSK